MRHLFCVFLAALAVLLTSVTALAIDRPLRVAGDENFPPYEFVDADGSYKGFNVDLMKAISLITDLEFEFELMPWETTYAAIENGQADIIQGMKVTEARKRHFAFTDTLVQNTDSIYIRTGTPGIMNFGDLAGKRVGVDYGDVRNKEFESLQGTVLITYQNPEMALLALHAGEVDALVCNTLVVNYFSNKHNIASAVEVVGSAFNQRDYAIAVAPDDIELLETLNAGIKAVQKSGIYDQLYRKWFGVPITSPRESFQLALGVTAGSLLLLIAISLAYNRVNRGLKQIIAEETAKQKAAMEKLREYDKLQFMSKIISSIAHEIRNPLTSIRFYAEQIPQKLDNLQFMLAVAEDIPPEIERIDALIKEFLEYTAPRKPDREFIRLRDAVEHVLSFLHMQLRNIDVRLDIAREIFILFDRNHLRQILLNILINSIDALSGKAEPYIRIQALDKTETVELSFQDNGGGIDEETMHYIFDPFYTTKQNGNGLGLFISRQMAEENGGSIQAESENGGTTIRLTAIRRQHD